MTSSLGTCVASARQPRPSQTSCPWSARWCAHAPARPRPSPQRSPRARVRRGAPLRVPKAARVLNAPRRAPQAHGESPPAAGAARGAQLVVLDRKADLVSPMVSHGPSRAGGPGGAGEDGAAVRDKAALFEHRARAVEAQALAGRCSADKALGCAEELLYARQPLSRVLRLFALIAQLSGGLRHHAHYLREISHVYGSVSTARCAPPAPRAPANTPARAHASRPARDTPPPRTKWTRRVPHPVLIGYAAFSPRTNRTRRVPHQLRAPAYPRCARARERAAGQGRRRRGGCRRGGSPNDLPRPRAASRADRCSALGRWLWGQGRVAGGLPRVTSRGAAPGSSPWSARWRCGRMRAR
jgi:hypothetical protein